MGKIVELLDPKTGLMKCRGCGMKFSPNIQPDSGGKFYPGSCKCPNECTAQDVKSNEAIKSVTAEMKKKSITCPGIKYSVLVSGFTHANKKSSPGILS